MEKLKKKTWLIFFLVIVILPFFLDSMNDDISSLCNSPITLFEQEHCGDSGHNYKNAFGEWEGGTLDDTAWDILLEPLSLFYPWLLTRGGLVHDLDVEDVGSGIVIDMHIIDPPIYEKILRVLLWFAHVPYWLILSYLFTKLWRKNWAGKSIIILFFLTDTLVFWFLLIFVIIPSQLCEKLSLCFF